MSGEFKLKPPKRVRDESEPFIIPVEEAAVHSTILDRFITDADHNGLLSHQLAQHLKTLVANAVNESFSNGIGLAGKLSRREVGEDA